MNRLERYLFTQFLGTVLFTCFAVTLVVWFSQAVRMLSLVINYGGSLGAFLKLMLLLLPTFLPLLLPICLTIGLLFVYQRLVSESELVVMRAAGLSPLALARPALNLAAILALIGYFLTLYIAPIANHEFVRLQYKIRGDLSVLMLHTGSFNDITQGLTFYARERGKDGELKGLLIHDTRKEGRPVTIMADAGELVHAPEGPRILVHNGMRQEMESATGQLSQLSFDSYMVDLSSVGDNFSERWVEPRERSLAQLLAPPVTQDDINMRSSFIAELHMRFALPFLSITFTLIACAAVLTGPFDRRGLLRRVALAAAGVVALEAAVLAVFNLMAKQPWMGVLLYMLALGPLPILYRRLADGAPPRPASGRASEAT